MDYQSLLFLIGDHQPAGAAPPKPVTPAKLELQERRLGAGLKLPKSLSEFYQWLGAGEFRFASVFSPVGDHGSSELDCELEDFRESQAAERLRALRSGHEIELLPFARNRAGTVFLFNLLERAKPDQLWTWESETAGDDAQPTPGPETFRSFLDREYVEELKALEETRDQLRHAIRDRRVIELSYRGQPLRTLQPQQFLPPDKNGERLLLGWQVGGYVAPGKDSKEGLPHFKSFHSAFCSQVRQTGESFEWTAEQLRELEAWEKRWLEGSPSTPNA